MSFWDIIAPRTMENQRRIARNQFQAGLQQPQLFQMSPDQMPIPQMRQAYETGYGMPWPTQQQTLGIEGMTTDPNRGTVIEPPENMPVEYVQPRTALDIAGRQGELQGVGAGQQKIAEYEQYKGMFGDADMDMDDQDVPGIDPATSAGFKRHDTTGPEGEPMVNIPGYGMLPASVGYRYLQDPNGDDKADIMVDPDGPDGPLPPMPSQHAYHYMQKPGTGSEVPPQVKSALSYFQAMAKQQGLDPKDAVLLALRPQLADQIKQSMDPQAKQLYDTMAMIVQKYYSDYAGQTGATDPMGIR